jgi:hypothetical protein
MSVVEEAVEEGGSHGSITGEDLRPVFEGDVGGDDDGARFVAFANGLEEEFGAAFVEREIAEFVEEKQRWVLVAFHFAIELALGVSCAEAVDEIDGGGKEDTDSAQAGGVTQGNGEVTALPRERAC